MNNFELISMNNIKGAKEITDKLEIIKICNEFGCIVNLIASVPAGLLINNPDMDFHIYPEYFCTNKIYTLIGNWLKKRNNRDILLQFLNTDYKSLDWHLCYQNDRNKDR